MTGTEIATGFTEQTFHMQCLYDVDWQLRRCRMLGKWTEDGASANINACSEYLSGALMMPYEYAIRLWRVQNLLAAVLLGFGQRSQVSAKNVREFHGTVSRLRMANPLQEFQWDWGKVRRDLMEQGTTKELEGVLTNLKRRVRASLDRNHTLAYRPELVRFISMLGQELVRRNGLETPVKE